MRRNVSSLLNRHPGQTQSRDLVLGWLVPWLRSLFLTEGCFAFCASFFDSRTTSAWCALTRCVSSRSSPVSTCLSHLVSPPSSENLICGQPYHDLDVACCDHQRRLNNPFLTNWQARTRDSVRAFRCQLVLPITFGEPEESVIFRLGNPERQGACL